MFEGFTPFTWFHTILSLVMLVVGIIVTLEMIGRRHGDGWTVLYLIAAILTCVTGFGFLPIVMLLPSHYVGIISLVLLAIALLARYAFHLHSAWRWIFAVCIVVTVWFDAFVFVTQLFLKVPSIHALAPRAPDAPEPPFLIVQGAVLVLFVILTIAAAIKFRPQSA